jgi:hypothetical protein
VALHGTSNREDLGSSARDRDRRVMENHLGDLFSSELGIDYKRVHLQVAGTPLEKVSKSLSAARKKLRPCGRPLKDTAGKISHPKETRDDREHEQTSHPADRPIGLSDLCLCKCTYSISIVSKKSGGVQS